MIDTTRAACLELAISLKANGATAGDIVAAAIAFYDFLNSPSVGIEIAAGVATLSATVDAPASDAAPAPQAQAAQAAPSSAVAQPAVADAATPDAVAVAPVVAAAA